MATVLHIKEYSNYSNYNCDWVSLDLIHGNNTGGFALSSFNGMILVHGLKIRRSLYFALSLLVNEKNSVALFEQLINAHFSNSFSVGELGISSWGRCVNMQGK